MLRLAGHGIGLLRRAFGVDGQRIRSRAAARTTNVTGLFGRRADLFDHVDPRSHRLAVDAHDRIAALKARAARRVAGEHRVDHRRHVVHERR